MLSIKQATISSPQQKRSISLKPIDVKMPFHHFDCSCNFCTIYEHSKVSKLLTDRTFLLKQKIKARISNSKKQMRSRKCANNYQWILKRMIIPQNKIVVKAISVNIPEILFYKDGEIVEMFMNRDIQDTAIKRITKEKLSNIIVQKIFGERRKKYRDYTRTKLGTKSLPKKKLLFGQKQVRKQVKDAVVISYVDGYEQLATENQLLALLQKRKQDQIWKQILFIQNFINIEQLDSNSIIIKYQRNQPKYAALFSRALQLIKIYGKIINQNDSNFITDLQQSQFEASLKQESKSIFAEYTLYKIVHFIEQFYDEKIEKVVVNFLVDEIGSIFLYRVFKLEYEELIKFEWTDESFRKKMDEEEKRFFYSKDVVVTEDLESKSKIIEQSMIQQYERMKGAYGLTIEEQDNQQQIANNEFFKNLYPGFNHNISEVLKDPSLTLSQFREQFLGEKAQKKPIVKQFTSNMIKTIHLMSPRVRIASPHKYVASPNKSNRTAHTINPQQKVPHRKTQSFSIRKLNQTMTISYH